MRKIVLENHFMKALIFKHQILEENRTKTVSVIFCLNERVVHIVITFSTGIYWMNIFEDVERKITQRRNHLRKREPEMSSSMETTLRIIYLLMENLRSIISCSHITA